MAQLTEAERRRVEAAVRRDLPGWKLSTAPVSHKKPPTSVADGLSVKRVGDLEQLRKKFLGNHSAAQDAADKAQGQTSRASAQRAKVSTVLVEPVDGGTKKIADVVNGHVKIVQG